MQDFHTQLIEKERGIMTHTTGPWMVSKLKPTFDQSQSAFTRPIYSKNGIRVAEIIGVDEENQSWLEEDESNARLITAASELLESLIELLKETNQHSIGNCPNLLLACGRAKLAINLATGKD